MEPLSPSVREVFGRVSDSRWFKILKRSMTEQVIKGVRFPGFAPPELQSYTVGSSGEHALKEAFHFYTYLKDICATNGAPVRPGFQILDFGVSWGRIIRFFLKDVDAQTLHGVDTSKEFLDSARATGVPGHLHEISPLGRLPYDDASFDLAYAYSVFTHLPEDVQDHWLRELWRALKPGAILVATVEPPRFLEFFAHMDATDAKLHPWHAAMARKIQSDPTMGARLQSSGFVYIPDRDGVNEVYGDCVMTETYAREHWGKYFEIVDWLDDRRRFWQALVVARKR
jgi:SAM-dependent methyltransferase